MHFVNSMLSTARTLFGNSQPTLSDRIASNDSAAVKAHLLARSPVSMDEFSQICFHMPCLVRILLAHYPEQAQKAPFALLLSLAKKSTHQDASYHVRPSDFDPTPSTEEILISLIKAGAPVDGKEELTDYTLLHYAIENKLSRAADVLLSHGIDQTATLRSKVTALHMAASDGYTFEKTIPTLAQNCLLLNAQNCTKATPLHYAARANSHRAIELLLEAGADRNIKDASGLTPLDITKVVDKNFFSLSLLSRTRAGYALVHHNISQCIVHLKNGDTLSDDDAVSSCVGNATSSLERLLTEYPESAKFFSDTLIVQILDHWTSPESIRLSRRLIDLGVGFCDKDPNTGKTALQVALTRLIRDQKETHPRLLQEQAALFELLEIFLSKATHEQLNEFFVIDESHFKEASLLKMPPERTVAQDLSCLAEFHPEAKPFLDKVANEEPFFGAPKAGTQALKDFYKTIRGALSLVVQELNTRGAQAKKTMGEEVAKKLADASGECGTQYLATALDLYNTYVTKIAPTMSSAFLEQLQALRAVLVENMTQEPYVNKNQTAHAVRYIKKMIGKRIALRDLQETLQNDVFAASGFTLITPPSAEGLYVIFKKYYTPFVIFEYVTQLMNDLRYRNFYIDWAKKGLKQVIPGSEQYYKEKKSLKMRLIDYSGSRRPDVVKELATLKENRRAEVISWLFYENSFKPKLVPIILSLMALHSIKNRY